MSGKHPYFSPAEFAGRIARLRQRLTELKVDAALFDEIESLAWLSGYGNSENRYRCVVIPTDEAKAPLFLIRSLDAGPCRRRNWIEDVVTFLDWEDPFPVLAKHLKSRGLERARIGLDFNSYGMPLSRFAQMRKSLPNIEFVDLGPIVWELRLIKSDAEIALLERAAGIADEALRRVAKVCRAGNSQRKAAQVAVDSFVELGADPGAPGPIAAGRGWDFLHAQLEESILTKDDVVHVELVPTVSGYSARTMRCIPVGEPTSAMLKAAETLAAIQDKQIAAMRPGAKAADIDAILRNGVLEAKLRDSVDNITGYTLGLYAQAGPRTSDFTRIFHPGANWTLKPGMVFHMYASAAGVSLSETVHVTKDGPRQLTHLPRTLLSAT